MMIFFIKEIERREIQGEARLDSGCEQRPGSDQRANHRNAQRGRLQDQNSRLEQPCQVG